MNQIKLLRGLLGMVALAGGSGCGLSTRTPTEEFTGKLGSDWDGQAPTAILAASSSRHEANLENGAFRLEVLGERSYEFLVVREDGSTVPLLFPRANGTTNGRLAVSGGTSFDFGFVRYVAPFDSTTVQVSTKSANAGVGMDGEYECEDGIDPNTGMTCVEDDDEAGTCNDGEHEDGEHEDEDEAGETDDDDIECEDGIDTRTGLACEDQDDDEDEDENVGSRDEAALPDHVPPNGVGVCGDDDDDDDDDNVEQEGEHEG